MSMDYEFRVDGLLPEWGRDAFCDMRIEEVPAQTVISGAVIDESHLHGIVAQLRALGLTVVSARPVPQAPPRASRPGAGPGGDAGTASRGDGSR
jgi:hypothetical protein